ncbi:class I SAM-dependent methyltransferase [Microcoleus sp. FACHB-672]|uniref:class I SAM-dependent methyltransferase n=1 Tax=Microcoleus sp. FACHB-672 TaxID=2692825 RepID=UPI001689706D|nr:class I SAM-dependent methyltransferase [Microcoleus sp. FACHB-672]MBD2040337.1 methyltransferase domain-containing protein [Microcoleus sp. FACHB-672]
MIQKPQCPVCKSGLTTKFLNREQVPVHQNLVIANREAAIDIATGELNLMICQECGFIFNKAFEVKNLSYGKDYDNTQDCSPSFNEYLDNLATYLIVEKAVRNCRVVEIGCGKGLFLRKLVEPEEFGNSGYGFDPSYIGSEIDLEGRLQFAKRYYGADCAEIAADVVVCRHVIEHIPEPLDLLEAVRKALVNSPKAKVFFETPCVQWILQNQVICDFFYEHCSYFTTESLTTVFEASGFSVETVKHVFGGQYLWIEATLSNEKLIVTKNSGLTPHLATQFAKNESQLKLLWESKIKNLAAQGKVALWGAGAKGVTFANLVDPQNKWIACIIDINPSKQGHYLPGTGHPIIGIQDLKKHEIDFAIVMNPNYREENIVFINQANLNIQLIDFKEKFES